jgi:DNA replication protein DnaC
MVIVRARAEGMPRRLHRPLRARARLFADLELAHGDGRFARLFRTLTKADLLILDDWGPEQFTASQRRDLMEIVEDRYGAGTTLITVSSQWRRGMR